MISWININFSRKQHQHPYRFEPDAPYSSHGRGEGWRWGPCTSGFWNL